MMLPSNNLGSIDLSATSWCALEFETQFADKAPLLRVAQYVRMSTEHQQYSTENQADMIARYSESHRMEIVKTYADHGRSGLSLAGREGLTRLLRDVETGVADFAAILVYDVSRWGRFQDADESAYYEYVIKRAGIRIHYCAEPFENDGSLPSSLLKTLKRTMAGEYSRELSVSLNLASGKGVWQVTDFAANLLIVLVKRKPSSLLESERAFRPIGLSSSLVRRKRSPRFRTFTGCSSIRERRKGR
jgi:hypothetical protein